MSVVTIFCPTDLPDWPRRVVLVLRSQVGNHCNHSQTSVRRATVLRACGSADTTCDECSVVQPLLFSAMLGSKDRKLGGTVIVRGTEWLPYCDGAHLLAQSSSIIVNDADTVLGFAGGEGLVYKNSDKIQQVSALCSWRPYYMKIPELRILIEDIPLCFNTHNKTVYTVRNTTIVYDIGVLLLQHVSAFL
jgi:hypothetical protein